VTTQFFTILYLPIVPLASYLVADAGGRSWRFFGKVPISTFHRWWRRGLLAAVAAVALVIGLAARAAVTRSEVRFVNALDVAVTTTLGPVTVPLPPGTNATRVLDVGRHHLVTKTATGETIEELDVDVPPRTDLVAYSVLGAAPILLEDVLYTTSSAHDARPPHQEPMLGRSWLVRDGVDYVFVTPPARLEMSGSATMRHRAGVADGGWRETVRAMSTLGDADKAAELACRIALLERDDQAVWVATDFAAVLGGDRLLAFGEKAVASSPTSVRAHRARQGGLLMLGRKIEARALYKAAFEQDPGSATFGYLYARLLPLADELPILEPLVASHPDDPWIRRALGATLHDLTRFAEAVPHFERLTAIDAVEGKRMLPYLATALAGSDRVPEAQRRVRRAIGVGDFELVVLDGRLARLPGAEFDDSRAGDIVALAAGQNADLGELRATIAAQVRDAGEFSKHMTAFREPIAPEACRLELASFADLADGAAKAIGASDEVLRHLDTIAAVSIACELAGTRRAEAARRVYAASPAAQYMLPRFELLATPAAALDDPDLELDLETRAVLAYAASRRATDPADRARHLARARAADVLRVIVPP
jgi:hypothetical protein